MINLITKKEEYVKYESKHKIHFLQSWEWGEVKKPEWQPLRLLIDDYPISILLRNIPFSKSKIAYLPRAFDKDSFSEDRISELVNYLCNESEVSHLIYEANFFDNISLQKLYSMGFKNTGKTIQPNWTNIVTLDKSYVEIFSNFDATYRRNIRKAEKLGLEAEILEEGSEALERFYKIMESIFSRTKFVMHDKNYFRKIWELISSAKKAKIYIAKKDKVDLGAIFVIFDETGAYELYGGISDEGKKYRTGHFLRHITISDAIKSGKEIYDQWGIAPFSDQGYDKKSELYNISLFKEGFGGNNIEYLPQLTYVFKPSIYNYFKLINAINSYKIKALKLFR